MKRLLTADEAAEYTGMGRESFLANCSVHPKRVRAGQRGLRWDVRELDEWVDNLAHEGEGGGEVTSGVTPKTNWLEKLDGAYQDQRREGVHK